MVGGLVRRDRREPSSREFRRLPPSPGHPAQTPPQRGSKFRSTGGDRQCPVRYSARDRDGFHGGDSGRSPRRATAATSGPADRMPSSAVVSGLVAVPLHLLDVARRGNCRGAFQAPTTATRRKISNQQSRLAQYTAIPDAAPMLHCAGCRTWSTSSVNGPRKAAQLNEHSPSRSDSSAATCSGNSIPGK